MKCLRVVAVLSVGFFSMLMSCVEPTPPLLIPLPAPTTTIRPRPTEVAYTGWELDHVLVNGQKQPPYHVGQSIRFQTIFSYTYSDACNSGESAEADPALPTPANPEGKVVRGYFSQTLQQCLERDPVTDQLKPTTWDKAFTEALRKYTWSELRDGYLYWHTSLADDTTLVFRALPKP